MPRTRLIPESSRIIPESEPNETGWIVPEHTECQKESQNGLVITEWKFTNNRSIRIYANGYKTYAFRFKRKHLNLTMDSSSGKIKCPYNEIVERLIGLKKQIILPDDGSEVSLTQNGTIRTTRKGEVFEASFSEPRIGGNTLPPPENPYHDADEWLQQNFPDGPSEPSEGLIYGLEKYLDEA